MIELEELQWHLYCIGWLVGLSSTYIVDFMEDSVLDMIKTLGEFDMIPVKNADQAIAYAQSWFPAKEDCPDDFHYWSCHVVGTDGDFEWKNVDSVPSE